MQNITLNPNFKTSGKTVTEEQMNRIGDYGVSAPEKSTKVQTPPYPPYTNLNSQTNHENQLKITTPKNPFLKTGYKHSKNHQTQPYLFWQPYPCFEISQKT